MASNSELIVKDNALLSVKDLVIKNAKFKIEEVLTPKRIVVSSGNELTKEASRLVPIVPVGIISFEEVKTLYGNGKLPPVFKPLEEKLYSYVTEKLLKQGTEVTLQIMPDSYYFGDERERSRFTQNEGIPCIIYIGNDTYQKLLVREGYGIYNTSEFTRLNEIFLTKGDIDREFIEELDEAEVLAISENKGFWSKELAFTEVIANIKSKLAKKANLNQVQLKEEVTKIKEKETKRKKLNPQDRLKLRQKSKEDERKAANRTYSTGSFGEQLSSHARYYFPTKSSSQIIEGIVAGLIPNSAIQIGSLWCGIPTHHEEMNGLGSSSHPVEIVEVKKDGDVRPVLGQGFLSMVMGDRPPLEGLTIILSVSSRGVENFIAPLLTQFRMDPIVPIRNLHIARFVRPIFSNRELYSKVFGKLPANLAKLINPENKYGTGDEDEIRELTRAIELMYLSVPIYVAVKQVQVKNLEGNRDSFTVTINCGVADVASNFGVYPEYFNTIEDAFSIHTKRTKVIDRMNTQKAISYIAKQIGSGNILNNFTFKAGEQPEVSKTTIKEFMVDLKNSNKNIKYSHFVLREGKFVHIPTELTYAEAQEQASGNIKNELVVEDKTKKLKVAKILVYKPSLGTSANYNLMKTLLRVRDMTVGQNQTWAEDKNSLLRHFTLSELNHIPIPIGSNTKYRTGSVSSKDIIPQGDSVTTSFLNNALNVESKVILDVTLLNKNIKQPITSLFGITSSDSAYSVYAQTYSNWKDNAVIGLGTKDIIQPFELCATRQIESGPKSLVTNLDVEYACSLGLPIVSIQNDKAGKKMTLKPVGFTNVEIDEESKTNLKGFSYTPVSFYEGNLSRINKAMGIISIGPDNRFFNALKTIVANDGLSTSFVPEMAAMFAYKLSVYKSTTVPLVSESLGNKAASAVKQAASKMFQVQPGEASNTIEGTYGTLKFYNSIYKNLSVVSDGNRRNLIQLSTDSRNVTEYSRDIIRQEIQFWNYINSNVIIGEAQKNPLQFSVNSGGKKVVTIGLTDVVEASSGAILFFFKEVNANKKQSRLVALKSSRHEEELLDLVRRYIEEIKSQKAVAEKTKGQIKNDVQKEVTTKIRNIVQSLINKDLPDLLQSAPVPDALSNINQILLAAKGVNGTKFLDECEPYVFSLFYQLGVVKGNSKYEMTFRVRPDRVPYAQPTSIGENYTSMTMEIFRPEPPKEEDRLDAYSNSLKQNEEFINRMDTQEGFNSYITQQATDYITKLTGKTSSNDIENELRKTIYTIAALQTVLLRYFDYVFSAHVVIKAGASLIGSDGKIKLTTVSQNSVSNNPGQKEVGKVSQEVKDAVASVREEIRQQITRIKTELKSVSTPTKDLPESGKITINNSDLLKDGYTVEDLIHINLEALDKVLNTAEERIYDSKTPNGDHFATYENIKRILSFSGLDNYNGTGSIQQTTSNVLAKILVTYKQTIEALKSKDVATKIVYPNNGGIEVRGAIAGSVASITETLQLLVGVTQKIRLATGNSLDFMKRKKLTLRKPVPSIGVIEEYGVSSPLRVPGKKKPSYQVIGGVSTQAYIQLNTGISDLYINEKSKIANVIEEEEGMDAIYNIMREPSDIVTIYNMLRSGRAMLRDSTIFTKGSNALSKVGSNNPALQESFRLMKRASIEHANIDAYGTLLGMTDPHIIIKEPLLEALGLSRFVAKTTKISSGGNTTSWKLDVFLLPYEAGYTTNKNLKKVNKVTSNKQLGDSAAWFGAAYNPAIIPNIFTGGDISRNATDTRRENTTLKKFENINLNAYESKVVMTRYAISAVFSNLVAMHAIYKAKRKVMNGIIDKTIMHPELSPELNSVVNSIASDAKVENDVLDSILSKVSKKSKSVVTELSLSATDFNTLSNYSELGLSQSIPISTEVGEGYGGIILGLGLGIGGSVAGGYINKAATAKLQTVVGGTAAAATFKSVAFLGKTLNFFSFLSDVAIALWETKDSNRKVNIQSASVVDSSIKDNMSVYVLLSQNFASHAIDFLQDFFAFESLNPGQGDDFIKLIASEAKSVINNAGSIEGIQFFNSSAISGEGKTQKISTTSGAIVSTYPIDSIVQNGTQQSFFTTSDESGNVRNIDKLSIVIVNSAVGTANDVDIVGRSMINDIYDPKDEKSFFSSYYAQSTDKRTEIDLCGEELLQLIIDGQASMFKTDIYSIALNPRYVASEPGLYYSAMLGILGRLKLNHFAQYLIGFVPAALHKHKMDTLLQSNVKEGESTDIGAFYGYYLNVILDKQKSSFKKEKNAYKDILSRVEKLFVVGKDSNDDANITFLKRLSGVFPLANGKLIVSRMYTALELYKEAKNFKFKGVEDPLGSDSVLTQLDPFLNNLNLLCNQIKSQMPIAKRPKEPIPKLFSVSSFFAFNSNVSTADTSVDILIPGNTTKGTVSQKIKKTDAYIYDEGIFQNQLRDYFISAISWILDAYGNILVGIKTTDLQKTDPSYGLRYAISEELIQEIVKERRISYFEAAQEVKDTVVKEVNLNISSQYSMSVQKACDRIALYSDGNKIGKRSLYLEYTSFLETFKELLLQVPYTKLSDGTYTKGYMDANDSGNGRASGSEEKPFFSIKGRKKDSIWSITDIDDLAGHLTIYLGGSSNKDKEMSVIVDSLKGVRNTPYGARELSSFSYADLTSKGEGSVSAEDFALFIQSLSFASIRYGIERPEYIPSVLARWKVEPIAGASGTNQIVIYRTALCQEFLSIYSSNFKQSVSDWLYSARDRYLTGNFPPLSGKAVGHAALTAFGVTMAIKAIGLFSAAVAGVLSLPVLIIIGIVVFLLLLGAQLYLKFKPPEQSLTNFQIDFLKSLRTQIGQTTITTTPLFTGVRALMEQVQGINESDLAFISLLGTKAFKSNGSLTHPRSEIYVNPPDLEDLIDATEFILQDTLSYLTIPLITKRQVITVGDVLSPGGHIVPDMKQFNENNQALASTLLVQEGFFKDNMERLPEFLQAEKAKGLALQSDKFVANRLEPTDPGSLQFGFKAGAINFLNNMEGIIAGYIGSSNAELKPPVTTFSVSHSTTKQPHHVLNAEKQVTKIYSKLKPLLVKADKPTNDEIKATIQIASELFPLGTSGRRKDADVFLGYNPSDQSDAGLLKNIAIDSIFYTALEKSANEQSAFSAAGDSTNKISFLKSVLGSKFNEKYNEIYSKAATASGSFDGFVKNILKASNMELNAIKYSAGFKDGVRISFHVWLESSFGSTEVAKAYFTYQNGIVNIIGTERGKGTGWLSRESHIAFVREVGKKEIGRAQVSQDKSEAVLIPIKRNELFLDDDFNGALIIKNKSLQNSLTFSDRTAYWFLSRIGTGEIATMFGDGMVYIKAASAFRKKYSHLGEKEYLTFNRKNPPSMDLSFIEVYAAKLALDTSEAENIEIKWYHIFQALEDIGSFSSYIGYATSVAFNSSQNREMAFFINRTDKVQEAPNASNITKFNSSSVATNGAANSTFAATTGLSTQYVLDKLEQYMDQESQTQWEVLGKVGREIKNILSAPTKLYPVAKLYFLRKDRGGFVLYDDIFSYADLMSVKVFDSTKTPGSTIIIQLANTENKLDNVLAAKDNSRNPFETRGRANDQLSGLLLKAGTRIMVYMGYGNILTEENKYLAEISSTSTNPDGTITIEARGPGWVLNNPINNVTGGGPKTPGKTLAIPGDKILSAGLPPNPTDPKNPEIATVDKFGKPANTIARNLLLYTMLVVSDISRYGRLGSEVSETVEYTAGLIPEDVTNSYSYLVEKGMQSTGFDAGKWLSSKVEIITLSLTGPLPTSASETFANGTENTTFKMNTFARNILLSESMPAVAGTLDSLRIMLSKPGRLLSTSTTPEWKINTETYWEFIKEVLLVIPNSKAVVRSYETDGSLVIGQADEYYTMYRSKTLSATTANTLFREIAFFKETRKIVPLFRRFYQTSLIPLSGNPDFANVEFMAEILLGVVTGLLFNSIDSGKIAQILNSVSQATTPLPIISEVSMSSAPELFNILKNKKVQSHLLAHLMSGAIGVHYDTSKKGTLDDLTRFTVWLQKNYGAWIADQVRRKIIVAGNKEYDDRRKLYEASDDFIQNVDIDNINSTPDIRKKYQLAAELFNKILIKIEQESDKEFNSFLQVALQLGFDGSVSIKYIQDVSKNFSEDNTDKDYAKRLMFTITACIARAYSNKMHKLRNLSPDRRKIQDQHFVFADRDIIHNDAMTMLGYNEGEFVFEEIRATTGEKNGNIFSGIPILQSDVLAPVGTFAGDVLERIGGILAPFASKLARFPFYIDPASAQNSIGTDYTAKRLMVNLNNPGYFSASMSVTEDQAPLINVLSIMATQQMAEMVKDWYGGNIFTYGDLERKPVDVVYLNDPIRDMYGPFEIKEVVHSFDTEGFISSMSPSVYTKAESRNITDEAEGSLLAAISDFVLGLLAATAVVKFGQLGQRLIGKIKGIGELLVKMRAGILSSTVIGGETGLLLKWPKKLAKLGIRATTGVTYKLIFDRIIKSSDYARRLTEKARVLASQRISGDARLVEGWLEINGFTTKDDFLRAFANWETEILKDIAATKNAAFLEAEAFFKTNADDIFKSSSGLEIKREVVDAIIEYERRLLQFTSKSKGSVYDIVKNGGDISKKAKQLGELRKAIDKRYRILSGDVHPLDFLDTTIYSHGMDFLHFVYGRSYKAVVANYGQIDHVTSMRQWLTGSYGGTEGFLKVNLNSMANGLTTFRTTHFGKGSSFFDMEAIGKTFAGGGKVHTMPNGAKLSKADYEKLTKLSEDVFNETHIDNLFTAVRQGDNPAVIISTLNKNMDDYLSLVGKYTGKKVDKSTLLVGESTLDTFTNLVRGPSYSTFTAKNTISAVSGQPGAVPTQIVESFDRIVAPNIGNVLDPNNAIKILSSADNAVPSAVAALTMENLRKFNQLGMLDDVAVAGGAPLKLRVREGIEVALIQNGFDANDIKLMKKAFESRSGLEAQDNYLKQLLRSLEKSVNSSTKTFKDIDGTVYNIPENFAKKFHEVLQSNRAAINHIVDTTYDDLVKARDTLASSVTYKDLSPAAKKVLDDAVELSTEAINVRKSGVEQNLSRVEKALKDVKDNEGAKKLLKEEINNYKEQLAKLEKELNSAKKLATGDQLRKTAVQNLEDAIKNKKDTINEVTKNITSDGIDIEMRDSFRSMLTSSSEAGVVNAKGYKLVSGGMTKSRGAIYNPDHAANMKEMLKSSGMILSLYYTYDIASSIVGDSITEYRIKVGAQKATDSLITLFMVYKGEPYLSNLEGLTRYKSKAITGDTHYLDYLASRFYNPSEIGEFIAGSFGNTVRSSLTQYTDMLRSSQVDTGLYSSIPSDIKFGGNSGGGESGIKVDIDGPVVSAALQPANKGAAINSGYGWRILGSAGTSGTVTYHSGVDIGGVYETWSTKTPKPTKNNPNPKPYSGNRAKNLGPHDLAEFYSKNITVALETSVAVFTSGKPISAAIFLNALQEGHADGSAPWNTATEGVLTLFGISSGIIWSMRHMAPAINSKDINENSVTSSYTPQLAEVGSTVGFVGPFGASSGVHIHLEAFKAVSPEAKKLFTDMRQAYKDGKVSEFCNSNSKILKELSYQLTFSYKESNTSGIKGFLRIDPAAALKDPRMNYTFKLVFPERTRYYHGQSVLTDEQRLNYSAKDEVTPLLKLWQSKKR